MGGERTEEYRDREVTQEDIDNHEYFVRRMVNQTRQKEEDLKHEEKHGKGNLESNVRYIMNYQKDLFRLKGTECNKLNFNT